MKILMAKIFDYVSSITRLHDELLAFAYGRPRAGRIISARCDIFFRKPIFDIIEAAALIAASLPARFLDDDGLHFDAIFRAPSLLTPRFGLSAAMTLPYLHK